MSEQVIVESPAVQAPVSNPVTTRDVLHRAADLLEEFGWCQRAYRTDESFCLVGALVQARIDFGIRDSGTTFGGLDDHFFAICASGVGAGSEWNDAPGRTRAEVVARLREAAERSEHPGGDR